MILLIMKSRPGLTVRRKFLQRLPLRENGNLVVKPGLRSHGGCVFVSPGLCFCVPWFRTREWCQSTGNLWAFPVVTGGSSPSRGDELRFLNKDLVVQRGRYGRWWHFSACSTFKKIETVLMYCARNRGFCKDESRGSCLQRALSLGRERDYINECMMRTNLISFRIQVKRARTCENSLFITVFWT